MSCICAQSKSSQDLILTTLVSLFTPIRHCSHTKLIAWSGHGIWEHTTITINNKKIWLSKKCCWDFSKLLADWETLELTIHKYQNICFTLIWCFQLGGSTHTCIAHCDWCALEPQQHMYTNYITNLSRSTALQVHNSNASTSEYAHKTSSAGNGEIWLNSVLLFEKAVMFDQVFRLVTRTFTLYCCGLFCPIAH
jgi:hypothetical protein